MIAALSLIPIFGYAFLLFTFFKKSVSTSIFFTISAIITTLFLFGMVGLLKFGTYVIFYLGIATFIYMAVMFRDKFNLFIASVPFVIFTFSAVIYLSLMQDAKLFFWDEYSHWGAFIKEMYYFGEFYGANSVAAHLRYPPGISIWDYFIVLPTGFSEGSLYFAYFLILFSSVLMMYEKLKWNQIHWIVLIFVTQMVVFATYGHWFSSIYVDHVVGSLFAGTVLAYLVDKYSYKEAALFAFPIIAIVLVKEIGLYFALAFVGLVGILSLYEQKIEGKSFIKALQGMRKTFGVFLVLFVVAFLALKAWNIRQDNLNVAKEKQSITGIVKNIFSDQKVLDAKTEAEVKKRFWEVVKYQQLHKEKLSLNFNEFSYPLMKRYEKTIKLSTIGSFVFFIFLMLLAYAIMYPDNKKREPLLIGGYLLFVGVVYLFILYFSFQVAFGSGALRIPSYVRYMNIAFLPLFFIAFFMFLPAYDRLYNEEILQKGTNLKLVLLIVGLSSFIFITKPYIKPLYSQLQNAFRQQIDQIGPALSQAMPPKSKVLVVFPVKNNGSLNIILEYALIPARATVTKYDFFDKKSAEDVKNEYVKYDFIWFASLNKAVAYKSKTFLRMKNKKQIYTFYQLDRSSNNLTVKPIF